MAASATANASTRRRQHPWPVHAAQAAVHAAAMSQDEARLGGGALSASTQVPPGHGS